MLFGGVFALAGLGLLTYRSSDVTQAHAELLGLKFRISSSGLVVFLVGAAFLAGPVVLTTVYKPVSQQGDGQRTGNQTGQRIIASSTPSVSHEPNDIRQQAAEIELGQIYTSSVDKTNDEIDFFMFYTSELPEGRARVTLDPDQLEGGDIGIVLTIYNQDGEEVYRTMRNNDRPEIDERVSLRNQSTYYLSVSIYNGKSYEYKLQVRPG